jgi:hypothetical protein
MANPNPVYIDFIVRGIPNVQKAFKTVQDSALAAARAQTQRERAESQQRTRLADQEAKAKVRATQQAERQKQQIRDRSATMAGQFAKKQAAEEARAERDKVRDVERAEREKQRIRDRSAQMAGKYYARLAEQERRANFVRERDEFRNRRRFASHMGASAVSGAQAGVQRIAGLTARTAGLVGQLGGGFSISDSVERNAKNAGDVADLINAGINRQSANRSNRKRRNRSDVEGALDVATTQYGLDRGSAIEGLRAFTGKTGDFDTALRMLPKLAELSRATATPLDKMAAAAGQAGLAFDNIGDGEVKMRKIMEVMRIVAGQGKAGTVEIADMATQMGKLVATAGKFEGDNVENLAKMGMLAQFAAGGGGAWNAASAATSVTAFGSTFSKGARLNAFKAKGIDVFTDKGETKLRAPEEIIADAFEKTGGKQSEVASLFGSAMSLRAVNKFGDLYSKGYETQDGKKVTGRQAILAAAKDMTATQMTQGEVGEAASERMREIDAQMAQTREKFDQAVREKVIPTLLSLVPSFEKLAELMPDLVGKALPAFVDLFQTIAKFADAHKGELDYLAAHPIAAILTAEIGKQMATAGLAELIKVSIAKSFGDAGMGQAFSAALGSKLGQTGLAVGTLVATVALAKMAIDEEIKDDVDAQKKGFANSAEASNLIARFQRGEATDADREKASQLVKDLRQDVSKQNDLRNNPGLMKTASMAMGNIIAPEATKEATEADERNRTERIDQLTRAMRDLETAMRNNTTATQGNPTGGSNSGPGGAARSGSIVQRNGVK